jgi:hypothetical protein
MKQRERVNAKEHRMNTTVMLGSALCMLLAVLASCTDLPVDAGAAAGPTSVVLDGIIRDQTTGVPIASALVTFTAVGKQDSVLTGVNGNYHFSFEVGTTRLTNGYLIARKSGYFVQSMALSYDLVPGQTYTQDLQLRRDTTTIIVPGTSGTGIAHTFALMSVSRREISVHGVGGEESSTIVWEVRDSLGFPIDLDHQATVQFAITGTPVVGGAYVSPTSAATNAAGRVATTINSGTVAGVVQFVANLVRTSDGATIRSTPVLVTVNAGLPDQAHFSIAPVHHNFAAYDWVGNAMAISVQVGDRYSNPVRPNTAVYFNTTGGIVTASGFTSETGQATVTLFSGNPLPRDPALSPPSLYGDGTGYAWVRGHTLGESALLVSDSTLMLFSGVAQITLSTQTISVPMLGSQNIQVNISDENGNPLAPGTVVQVDVQVTPPEGANWSATASGLPTVAFGDNLVRGPGRTDFVLRIADATAGGTPQAMPIVVTITVTGPNIPGSAITRTLSGTVGGT